MPPLRDRPTADVIVLGLTAVVGFVIVVITALAVVAVFTGHVSSVSTVLKSVGDLTNGLIALIVGYVAGRGVNGNGKNGNGSGSHPPQG
jgi:VIT1/CCC1 family predicted Fe2+/Mn2+ transporter